MSAIKNFVPRALKMSQGAILSTPLPSAPVATRSLPEAQLRAKAFFREVVASFSLPRPLTALSALLLNSFLLMSVS
jgi:hypothetical protein